jgi:5'-nucleotidase
VTLQILLTNDDGIFAPGLAVLRAAVEGLGEVTTLAPDYNASAVARAITIDRALHVLPATFGHGWEGFACDGTPSDCVRIGLLGVACPRPGLVVAGVNAGGNMGADTTYSGTVGAAFEAALRGLPAVSVSVESMEPEWLPEAIPLIRGIVRQVVAHGLPRHTILNVNLPDRPLSRIAGVLPARLGGASLHDRVFVCLDGDSSCVQEYFLAGDHPTSGDWAATDFEVVAQGSVALTPMRYDLLDPEALAGLREWDLDLEALRA